MVLQALWNWGMSLCSSGSRQRRCLILPPQSTTQLAWALLQGMNWALPHPVLSTSSCLPLGTLALWLHYKDIGIIALELQPCPLSDWNLSKGKGSWISHQSKGLKLSLYAAQCVQTVILRDGLGNWDLMILALSAVWAYCVNPFLFALRLMVVLETLQEMLLSNWNVLPWELAKLHWAL